MLVPTLVHRAGRHMLVNLAVRCEILSKTVVRFARRLTRAQMLVLKPECREEAGALAQTHRLRPKGGLPTLASSGPVEALALGLTGKR